MRAEAQLACLEKGRLAQIRRDEPERLALRWRALAGGEAGRKERHQKK